MKSYKKMTVGIAALLMLPVMVLAHAFVDHAEPEVGGTVTTPLTEIRVWFTQDLLSDCSIQVLDAAGKQVDLKNTKIDDEDHSLLKVSLPADLKPGVYKVVWKVVSEDTHKNDGDFTFTYKPAPATHPTTAPTSGPATMPATTRAATEPATQKK
ncbi:MAG TPA: copper resistance protein CopC [Phycisphaerae bacterium]